MTGPVADDRARVIAEVLERATETFRFIYGSGEITDAVEELMTQAATEITAALPTPAPEAGALILWCEQHDRPLAETGTPPHHELCPSRSVPRTKPTAPEAPAGEDATPDDKAALAEALDDLIMSKGVALDEDRLDWLVEWFAQRGAADQATLAAVRALAEDLTGEVEELRADIPPVGPSRVAHIYRTAGLSDARDRLTALLDGPDAGGGRRG